MTAFAGFFGGLGTTIVAPALLPASLFYILWKQELKWPIFAWPLIISILISTTINGKIEGLFIALAIFTGIIILPNLYKNYSFVNGLIFGITIISIFIFFDLNVTRPHGMFKNGLAASQVATLTFVSSSGGFILPFIAGLTLSRTPILILISSYFILSKKVIFISLILFLLGFILQNHTLHNTDTLGRKNSRITNIVEDIKQRELTIIGTENREFQLWGYGLSNYVNTLGVQRPHNALLSLWWQMGLLSIPIFLNVLWLAYRHLNWKDVLPLGPPLMLGDFLVADISGVVMLMFYITFLKHRQFQAV